MYDLFKLSINTRGPFVNISKTRKSIYSLSPKGKSNLCVVKKHMQGRMPPLPGTPLVSPKGKKYQIVVVQRPSKGFFAV
jgi:hypothetical protein